MLLGKTRRTSRYSAILNGPRSREPEGQYNEAVLKRPEQGLAHGLGLRDIDRFLAILASGCEPVEVSFQWRPQLRDPNDEMVLEAAVNGRADALITHNARHFEKSATTSGLRVLRPGGLLKELRS